MSWRIRMNIVSSREMKPHRQRTLPVVPLWNSSKIQFHLTNSIPQTRNFKSKIQTITTHCRFKRSLSKESSISVDKRSKLSPESPRFVLVCGQNICGQLGLSTSIIERRKPQHLKIMNQLQIEEDIQLICAGAMHSCALTVTGYVYTWGCNDDGALGRMTNDIDDEYLPGLFALSEEIQAIGAGDSFTVALTKSGRVYISGCFRSSEGVLGLLEYKQIAQQAVIIPLDQSIKQVACGADFCLLLTENDELYSFGNNETGQLGRDASSKPEEIASTWLQPSPIPCFQGQHILNIWAGGHGFFVLTEDYSTRHLFACGANSFGQLGDSSKQPIYSPIEIKDVPSINKMIKIACGLQHTLLLNSTGCVYGLGRSDDGRLGSNLHIDLIKPNQINNLQDIVDIAASGSVSFAITTSGEIYSFGMGDTCQTGHGHDDIFIPTKIHGKQLETRRIRQISVGAQHTLFLVHENTN